MPTAQTRILTDRASRYLVQLCEHVSRISHADGHGGGVDADHRPDARRVQWTESHGLIDVGFGRCELQAAADSLTLRLSADDPAALERLRQMFTQRLETIGRRDRITVTW